MWGCKFQANYISSCGVSKACVVFMLRFSAPDGTQHDLQLPLIHPSIQTHWCTSDSCLAQRHLHMWTLETIGPSLVGLLQLSHSSNTQHLHCTQKAWIWLNFYIPSTKFQLFMDFWNSAFQKTSVRKSAMEGLCLKALRRRPPQCEYVTCQNTMWRRALCTCSSAPQKI